MPSRPRLVCAILVASAASAAMAGAQNYRADEVDRSLKSRRQIAIRIVKSGADEPDAQQQLRAYIEKYHLPAMTQYSPEALEDLEKLRVDLFRQFIYPARGATQKYLSDKAKAYAARVVGSGRYHPSVRYTALLVLGQIDRVYSQGGQPPTPDAAANKLLCKVAAGAAKQANLPKWLLAGALVGLDRHTQLFSGLPDANRQLTVRALGVVLTADELAGATRDGVSDWFYLKAARTLANLGDEAPAKAAFAAIARRVADAGLAVETRAALAATLGGVGAKPGAVDAAPAIKAIVELAELVAETELETMEAFEDLQLNRSSGAAASEGGRGKTARRYRIDVSQRRPVLVREGQLALLIDLRKGVEAVAPLTQGDDATRLAAIAEALRGAIVRVRDTEVFDLNVVDAIREMAAAITDGGANAQEGVEEALDF